MKTSANDLNAWLSANHQHAINSLSEQGLTLRFVDGPANYHQEHASLAVGAEGVGFTFQMNHNQCSDPKWLVEQAVDRAPAFQAAFAAARQQYGADPLPLAPGLAWRSLLERGEGWDVCNDQPTTTAKQGEAQRLHWLRHGVHDDRQDVAHLVSKLCQRQVGHVLVSKLCQRQALYDQLRTPEGLLALVREPGSMVYNEDEDAYALGADRDCLLMLGYDDSESGRVVSTQALCWDAKNTHFFPLFEKTQAQLSSEGVQYSTDGFAPLTTSIDAKDLGMEPSVMEAAEAMGMTPLGMLQFDAARAQAEAGTYYLADLDGEAFLASDEPSLSVMR